MVDGQDERIAFNAAGMPVKKWGWLYAALAILLLGPFLLREVSGELEAYPAVLFPVGASIIQLSDTSLVYQTLEVCALMPDGSEATVPNKDFLGRIPVQYFPRLYRNRFGLMPRRYSSRWSNWLGRARHWTRTDRQRTQEWLAWRAKETGHPQAVAFRFRAIARTVGFGSGNVLSDEVKDTFDLPFTHE